MILSDALSRWPDHGMGADQHNEDIVLLLDALFINLLNVELQQRIRETKNIDPLITPIYNALAQNTPTTLLPSLNDW